MSAHAALSNPDHVRRRIAMLLLALAGLLPAAVAIAAEGTNGKGSVGRVQFTSRIADREPVDAQSAIPNSQERVYFFTELIGLEGRIITHRWEYQGKVMAEIKFQAGGPRWRVYSSKNLLPQWTGEWKVVVTDEYDAPLHTGGFTYNAP